jgi:N utilization substance protein B
VTARTGSAPRRRARELAFRVLYQADLLGDPVTDAWAKAREDEEAPLDDDPRELVEDIVRTIASHGAEIDAMLTEAAEHWELARLAATDRAVMRSATAELIARPGMPVRVVLDEAITLAKRFGSEESGGFVNGVLDRVARRLRPEELS